MKIVSLICLLFISFYYSSQDYTRLIQEGKYISVWDKCQKKIRKDSTSIEDLYFLALVSSKKNADTLFNPTKALYYVSNVKRRYNNIIDEKYLLKLGKISISNASILLLEDSINYFGYNLARDLQTEESYSHFLSTFTSAKPELIQIAIGERNRIAFENAQKKGTVESFQNFINNYPSALQVNVAILERNKLAYEFAKTQNSIMAFQDFIDNYHDAIQVDDARKEICHLSFENVKRINSIESYEAFLDSFPNSVYTNDALESIEELHFIRVKSSRSSIQMDDFINEYPNSKRLGDAKLLFDEFQFNEEVNLNDWMSLKSFIESYSNNSFTTQAKNHLINLAIEKDEVDLFDYVIKNIGYDANGKLNKKLEQKKWNDCLNINTKESYSSFIKDFPNSTNVDLARLKINKIDRIFDVNSVISYTSISEKEEFIIPTDKSNQIQNLTFLKISDNGKYGLAISSLADDDGLYDFESDNIARIVDMLDGMVIHEFNYEELRKCTFDDQSTKIYFLDGILIKFIDLNDFSIKTLFEIEKTEYTNISFFIIHNQLNVGFSKYIDSKNKFIHYSYDINNKAGSVKINIYDDFDYSVGRTIEEKFNFIRGNVVEKLSRLKIMERDKIFFKQVSVLKPNDFILIDYPTVYYIKNEIIQTRNKLKIYKRDENKGIETEYELSLELNSSLYSHALNYVELENVQITKNNHVLLLTQERGENFNSIVIFPLFEKSNNFENSFKTHHVNPFQMKIPENDVLQFVHFDDKTGKLLYQLDYRNPDEQKDNILYVFEVLKNNRSSAKIRNKIVTNLDLIDKKNLEFYSSVINPGVIKNKPLENDSEKYQRVQNLYNENSSHFIQQRDSLFNSVNRIIFDSIKVVSPNNLSLFNPAFYDEKRNVWKLKIENPFGGRSCTIEYFQNRAEAKQSLDIKFWNFKVEVHYYFNLISLNYEPLLVKIFNDYTKETKIIIVPFKDKSLVKNIYFTDNSFEYDLFRNGLQQNNIDSTIFRYQVNLGIPKFYFEFPKYEFYGSEKNKRVKVHNLDDALFSKILPINNSSCCPSDNGSGYYESDENVSFLSFNKINHFVNYGSVSEGEILTKSFEHNNVSAVFEDFNYEKRGALNLKYNWIIKDSIIQSSDYYEGKKVSGYLVVSDLNSNSVIKKFNVKNLGEDYAKVNYYQDKGIYINENNQVTYSSAGVNDACFSPNGEYFAMRWLKKLRIYKTKNWENILNIENVSGRIYWDCNSNYVGIDDNIFPIKVLEKTLD